MVDLMRRDIPFGMLAPACQIKKDNKRIRPLGPTLISANDYLSYPIEILIGHQDLWLLGVLHGYLLPGMPATFFCRLAHANNPEINRLSAHLKAPRSPKRIRVLEKKYIFRTVGITVHLRYVGRVNPCRVQMYLLITSSRYANAWRK